MSKKIEIPGDIVNDVRMYSNQLEDMARNLLATTEKMNLVKAKMWDMIHEKVPDTRGLPCSLDIDTNTVTVRGLREKNDGGMTDAMRDLLGGAE